MFTWQYSAIRQSGCGSAVFILSLSLAAVSAADTAPPLHLFEWGRGATYELGVLGKSVGVAVDQVTGEVYVTSEGRVQRFDSNGTPMNDWNCGGCEGLEVDSASHHVYVGNVKDDTVKEFTPDGTLVREWGGTGADDGQFSRPREVAVDPLTGDVYVFDAFNSRVQVFDRQGNFLRKWGSPGRGDGQFVNVQGPHAVAFDPNNRLVYVSDPQNGDMVQKFDELGSFISKFGGVKGVAPGQSRWIRDIEIANDGNIYVADSDNERIQVFDPQGNSLAIFQGPHNVHDGPFHPRSIAINRNTGEIYVAAAYAHRIDKFDAGHHYLFSWGEREVDGNVFNLPLGIATSPVNGDIYVRDTANFMVKQFSPRGEFKAQWGASSRLGAPGGGWGDGLFGLSDNAIAVSKNGAVWTASSLTTYRDPTARFVQEFSADGDFIQSFQTVDAKSSENLGLALDEAGGRYLLSETMANEVRQYDFNGGYLGPFAKVAQPAGIALRDNRFYVADRSCDCIRVFSPTGAVLDVWGETGSAPGQLNLSPFSGLATDIAGNLYVADTDNHRVQVFAPDGGSANAFGGQGRGPGEFRSPQSVAVSDAYDSLYVVESLNNRVQVFALQSPTAATITGAPVYTVGEDGGTYLWREFVDGPYHLRINGQGEEENYSVRLVSSREIAGAWSVAADPSASVTLQASGFTAQGVVSLDEAGVDFYLSPGSEALVAVERNGVAVEPSQFHVGGERAKIAPVGWILPLADLPERPWFASGRDLGLFIGTRSDKRLVEARMNGDGERRPVGLRLTASEPFRYVSLLSIESNDTVMQTPSSVSIDGYVSTDWDGVQVEPEPESNLGITFRQDHRVERHYVNWDDSWLGIPNAFRIPNMTPNGAPQIDGLSAAAIYAWKDAGTWRLRFTAGGDSARYVGYVESSQAAELVKPVMLEDNDTVDASDPMRIAFDLRVNGRWQDGIDFRFPDGAAVTLVLDLPADAAQRIRIGAEQWPVQNLPLLLSGW